MDITYTAPVPEGAEVILVPGGLKTPHGGATVIGAEALTETREATTGQRAYHLTPGASEVTIRFRFDDTSQAYPDAMFTPHPSRFTQFADALVEEIDACSGGLTGLACARAIACHVAERFSYAHVDTPFNDGTDMVPALGCGMVEGSCVDINTYFIACLRAAGIEAGYVTGYFFPEEKQGRCDDGHCWVVTRIGSETCEWDIAHHLKMGTREIAPGLNPKPGTRYACFHSMGLDFPDLGVTGIKALIEPVAVVQGRVVKFARPEILLHAEEVV